MRGQREPADKVGPPPRIPSSNPQPSQNALDPEDIAALLAVDEKTGKTIFELRRCTHCGGVHDRACPRVKKMVFSPSGGILEVEFWPKWDDRHIIYPEMLGVVTENGQEDR